jgi:hypothetical protein
MSETACSKCGRVLNARGDLHLAKVRRSWFDALLSAHGESSWSFPSCLEIPMYLLYAPSFGLLFLVLGVRHRVHDVPTKRMPSRGPSRGMKSRPPGT